MHALTLACLCNAFKKGLLRHVNEPARFGADGTTGKGCRAIAMKTLIVRAHIHRNDVPFLQGVMTRNSVDNRAVNADARACRVAVVIQERRFRALRYDEIVNGLIYRLR